MMLSNKWIERLQQDMNEWQYWKMVISSLAEDGKLEDENFRCLWEFIHCEEVKEFLSADIVSEENKKIWLQELKEKIEIQRKKYPEEKRSIYLESEWTDATKWEKESLEDKKEYWEEDEKYRLKLYKRVEVYIILYRIFENYYNKINDIFQKKAVYQKYGRWTTYSNYYENPISDLILSNVKKSMLRKKRPADLSGMIEYTYQKDGDLLFTKWYGDINFIEFCFMSQDYVWKVKYRDDLRISDIFIQRYEAERIVNTERCTFRYYSNRDCSEFVTESYQYSNDILNEALIEEYYFPLEAWRKIGILRRNRYFFISDSDGYLKGYTYKQLQGDGVRYTYEDVPISMRKRKSTGKDAGRWRKPNYFIK